MSKCMTPIETHLIMQGSKGHGGHCPHFIVIGLHCPPPSPLFSMMYKSINGGWKSAIRHPKISESGPQPINTLIYLYPYL